MDVNYTYCGAHLKIHANKELHCPSQASVIVYVSYTSIKQMGERELSHLSPSFCGMVGAKILGQIFPNCKTTFCHKNETFVFPVNNTY